MISCNFNQLVDMRQLRSLLEAYHALTGMEYSILDGEGRILIAVGWQEICSRFHRANHVTLARCRESDSYIKAHLHDAKGDFVEYRCTNGLIDVAMPILIEERHVATFFTGQFFYDDDRPDREFFRGQAEAFGFDPNEYFRALDRVPVFSRDSVRRTMFFLSNMVRFLAEAGLKNLKLARETEERSRVEERLSLMSFALDHVREAVYLIDEQAQFRYVNAEACHALGYDRAELLTLRLADVNPDVPLARWPDHWRDVKERGSLVVEGYHRGKNDHLFPVEIYISYFEFNGEGFLLALARDITERRWMESSLRASERLYRTLTENSPDIIMRYDRKCRRVYVNPSYSRESGIATDMARGISVEKLWPEGMNISGKDLASILRRVMENGIPAELFLEWKNQETGRVASHILNVVAERESDGTVSGCLAIGHNISGRREAEFRLARLAESSPGVMFNLLLRPDGTACMPYVSVRMEALSGIRPEDVTEDMSAVFARIHPDDRVRVHQSIMESARTLTSWHSEFRVRHPARGSVWLEGRSTPEPRPDGGVFWSGFFHDITERKEAEEALDAKQRQLSSMAVELSLAEEQERRRIASELHDHIGQQLLLTRIKLGSLASRLEGSEDEETYRDIQELLGQTIDDVRSLTQQLNPPLLSSVGLEAALEWLARRMERDYSVRVHFSDDGRRKPLCAELRTVLYQSARELLINVAKHAGSAEAWLHVGRDGTMFRLIVKDRGSGFACPSGQEMQVARNGSYGLFNIRQRTEYLGGTLEIDTVPGRGTCVTLRVPLMDEASMGKGMCRGEAGMPATKGAI